MTTPKGSFAVPYHTKHGNWIKLPLPPDFPANLELREQMASTDHREAWMMRYLDEVYAEYRSEDNRRRTDISADAMGDSGIDYFASTSPDPERVWLDADRKARLSAVLTDTLTSSQLEYVRMHVLENMSYPQIVAYKAAQGIVITPDVPRKQVERALRRLSKIIPKNF